jgi:hypothetical protein
MEKSRVSEWHIRRALTSILKVLLLKSCNLRPGESVRAAQVIPEGEERSKRRNCNSA